MEGGRVDMVDRQHTDPKLHGLKEAYLSKTVLSKAASTRIRENLQNLENALEGTWSPSVHPVDDRHKKSNSRPLRAWPIDILRPRRLSVPIVVMTVLIIGGTAMATVASVRYLLQPRPQPQPPAMAPRSPYQNISPPTPRSPTTEVAPDKETTTIEDNDKKRSPETGLGREAKLLLDATRALNAGDLTGAQSKLTHYRQIPHPQLIEEADALQERLNRLRHRSHPTPRDPGRN